MSVTVKTTVVKGGKIRRDARTGRFLVIQTKSGKQLSRKATETAVKGASSKRSAALKRLADR